MPALEHVQGTCLSIFLQSKREIQLCDFSSLGSNPWNVFGYGSIGGGNCGGYYYEINDKGIAIRHYVLKFHGVEYSEFIVSMPRIEYDWSILNIHN